jgi:hypothetical protein
VNRKARQNMILTREHAKAVNDHQRACGWEVYLTSRKEALAAIDNYFKEVEEDFFQERERVGDPYLYDEVLLQIIRNSHASELLLKVKETYDSFIRNRAKLKLYFPPIYHEKDELDIKVEKELVRRGIT